MSTAPPRSPRTRYQPEAGPPSVWFVGEWGVDEFVHVLQVIDTQPAAVTFATLEEASAAAGNATPPEVLLLAQPRPGCIEQSAIDAFQAASPLTRIVVVVGSWCEGERRTGRPLVGAVRLYWHEFPAWWRGNLAIRLAGRTPDWSRPGDLSSSVDGANPFRQDASSLMSIAIDSIDIATFETLADALRVYDITCTWIPRGRGNIATASAVIWDGGQLDPSECETLGALRTRLGNDALPIVALLDYPRAEHIEQAQSLGAAAVLGKPYSVTSLVSELSRVLQPPAPPGGVPCGANDTAEPLC